MSNVVLQVIPYGMDFATFFFFSAPVTSWTSRTFHTLADRFSAEDLVGTLL